jgi:hypothetical protein
MDNKEPSNEFEISIAEEQLSLLFKELYQTPDKYLCVKKGNRQYICTICSVKQNDKIITFNIKQYLYCLIYYYFQSTRNFKEQFDYNPKDKKNNTKNFFKVLTTNLSFNQIYYSCPVCGKIIDWDFLEELVTKYTLNEYPNFLELVKKLES